MERLCARESASRCKTRGSARSSRLRFDFVFLGVEIPDPDSWLVEILIGKNHRSALFKSVQDFGSLQCFESGFDRHFMNDMPLTTVSTLLP